MLRSRVPLSDTNLDSVENQSDRWIVEDTDSFYYDIKDNGE
jgi:hypothetical protein